MVGGDHVPIGRNAGQKTGRRAELQQREDPRRVYAIMHVCVAITTLCPFFSLLFLSPRPEGKKKEKI